MYPIDHTAWMSRCLLLAEQAQERGNAAIGALVVKNMEIVAEAFELAASQNDIAAHAELIAIRLACRSLGKSDLSDCVMYTNVEPCWMCSYAIRESGIAKVVIGRPIEDIGGATSRYPILSDATIKGWGPPPIIEWYSLSAA